MGVHFMWIAFVVIVGWLSGSQADLCNSSSVSSYECVGPPDFTRTTTFDSCNRSNACVSQMLPVFATGECNGVTTQKCSIVDTANAGGSDKDECSSFPCRNGGICISQREGVLCCYCEFVIENDRVPLQQACYDTSIVNVSRTPCADKDGAPPTIDSCDDVRTNKVLVSDIISELDVTAADNVNNSVPIHCVDTNGALLASNKTTFNCTATDTAEGQATCTFNVVLDQQAPIIHNCPSNVRANIATVTWSDPTATDDDGTNPEVTCTPAAGSLFLVDATTIVGCNTTDVAGNEANCTFNVTVESSSVTCPVDHCQNGGQCLQEGTMVQFSCNCSDGFTGDLCQTPTTGTTLTVVLVLVVVVVIFLLVVIGVWIFLKTRPDVNLTDMDIGSR